MIEFYEMTDRDEKTPLKSGEFPYSTFIIR